jgi:hypothetical protein
MDARHRQSPIDRVDAAHDERNEGERLRDEARYRRERLELWRKGERPVSRRAGARTRLRALCGDWPPRKVRDFESWDPEGVGSSYTAAIGTPAPPLPLVVHTPAEEASWKVSQLQDQRAVPRRMISTAAVQLQRGDLPTEVNEDRRRRLANQRLYRHCYVRCSCLRGCYVCAYTGLVTKGHAKRSLASRGA